jgi:hypothetical protein
LNGFLRQARYPRAVGDEPIPLRRGSHGPSRHGPDCCCVRCTGFQRGHRLSLRHGGRAVVAHEARARELADDLRELVPARSEADEPMIRLLALTLAQVEAMAGWLSEHGLVDEDGEARSILKHFGTMLNSAARIADRLGLSPLARAQLGLDLSRTDHDALRRLAEEGRALRLAAEEEGRA